MAYQRKLVVFAIFLMIGVYTSAAATGWLRFCSSKQFSVLYPRSWVRSGSFGDRLQILSSKGGAEGVVIKRGQAEITVMEAPGGAGKSLAQVIGFYTEGTSVLSQRDLLQMRGGDGCLGLTEVISKESVIPAGDSPIKVPYIINTDFFCVGAQGRKIAILLRNWQGDKQQAEYRQVARQIARSVRFS